MEISLAGKVALVTGASRGIGRAIASRLGRSGADLALLSRRPDVLSETVEDLRGVVSGRILGVSCDVASPEQTRAAFDQVSSQLGGVDIIISNAGSSARRPFPEVTREGMVADFDLKLFPAVLLSQLAHDHMHTQHWGRIIQILSVVGKAPPAGTAPTSVTRAAGIALTKVMASELAPSNILVNAICVGFIKSDQWVRWHEQERPDLDFEDYLKTRTGSIPLGRLGEAEEVANLACFLASDAAAYITGAAINADGGRSPVP